MSIAIIRENKSLLWGRPLTKGIVGIMLNVMTLMLMGLLSVPIFAQATSVDIPAGVNLIGTGITGGILVWYLWFNVTRIQPSREKLFIQQLADQEREHVEAIEKQSIVIQDILNRHREERNTFMLERATFAAEVKSISADFRAEMKIQRDNCAAEVASVHAMWERWTAQKFGQAAVSDPTKPASGILG